MRSSWRACLQALVAGDYLTPAFVGLGWRDNFSPPGVDGGSLLFADDRAALLERAWERHYDHVVKGEIPDFWAQVAQDLAPPAEPPSGLRARFGFVAEKTIHANGWLPLLLLNATSVDSGTRIIASDLVSTRPAPLPPSGNPDNAFGRFSLYPAAFDVFEILAPPCAEDNIVGPSCASAHDGVKDLPLARAGPDLRLSTAALLSARFPIISPAGILRAEGEDAIGDRAVDGGYFENSGLTSAMDVARELRRFGVVPIVLWVQNDPRVDPGDPAPPAPAATVKAPAWVPPRGASTPFMGASEPRGLERAFGVVIAPVTALTETRDGHGAEVAAAAQRDLWTLNQDVTPSDPAEVGSSYFVFGMFQNPDFSPLAGETPPADCGALAKTWRAGVDAMNEVSMSWWLSQSVQAEVDAQRCDRRNRATLADLMNRLSQRCPVKRRDPSDPTLSPAAAAPGAPERCEVLGGEVGQNDAGPRRRALTRPLRGVPLPEGEGTSGAVDPFSLREKVAGEGRPDEGRRLQRASAAASNASTAWAASRSAKNPGMSFGLKVKASRPSAARRTMSAVSRSEATRIRIDEPCARAVRAIVATSPKPSCPASFMRPR